MKFAGKIPLGLRIERENGPCQFLLHARQIAAELLRLVRV